MSAVELALEKVKGLSEAEAKALLSWLAEMRANERSNEASARMNTALGFARHYRKTARSTDDWMKELREENSNSVGGRNRILRILNECNRK